MRLSILGPVEAWDDAGNPIDLGRRKQRALLAVLALEPDQVVPLDRLIDLLWPDEPPDKAAGSIQGYVSNLRRALEPDRRPRMPSKVILTQAPGYLLRRDAVDLDAARFEALVADGERLLGEGNAEPAREALVAALALWRGPAVADFAAEPFAIGEASRLDDLRLVATEDRLEADLALGYHARAVTELEAMVARHPFRERVRGLLMVALYHSGRQAEALRTYQEARRVLADELGLEPGPELQALEAGILAQSPGLTFGSVVDHRPVPAPRAAATGRLFVGRRSELGVLTAAVAEARSGHGRVALVSGDAGIGKTTLCEELVADAASSGAVVAWSRAYEGEGAPAFWSWVQIVRSLVASFGSALVRSTLGSRAADLEPMVPDLLGRAGPPAGPPIDPEAARFRLFEAVTHLLTGVGAQHPLVVVLDDVHWADADSLELLGFLAGAVRDARLLVVATYRPTEQTPALIRTLAELARQPTTGTTEVAGLAPAEVGRLLAKGLDAEPEEALVRAVHERTDGNPFYVVELVRLLSWRPEGAGVTDLARDVPRRVIDVLRDRMARLPEGTNALLELASVAGADVELALLEQASGLDAEEVIRLLDGALARGLLADEPRLPGVYRFTHALVRDALYASLSSVRRAQLHGRVAGALEHLYATDDERAAALAHHAAEAVAVEGPGRALGHIVRAADVAQARMAFEQAEEHLDRALGLVGLMVPGTERDVAELGVQLRIAAWGSMTNGWTAPGTRGAWARAAELCELVGAMDQLAASMWGLYVLSIMTGDHATSLDIADRLVAIGEASGDSTVALVGMTASAYNHMHRGDLAEGVRRTGEAMRLARQFDDRALLTLFSIDILILMLGTSAWAVYLSGDDDTSTRQSDEALLRAETIDHPFSVAAGLALVATLAAVQSDSVRCLATSERAMAIAEEHGIRHYNVYAQAVHGWAVAVEGEPETGVAQLESALADMDAMGWVLQRPIFLSLLADARRHCGRLAGALEAAEAGLLACDAYRERFWEAELWRQRGELVALVDPARGDEADRWLARAAEVTRHQGAVRLYERVEASQRARARAAGGSG